MTFRLRPFALGALVLPLALAAAACGDKTADGAAASGEPVAKVAPPAGKAWTEVVTKTEEGGYRMGNPDAPIKVVEYGALSCSHCAEFAKEASEPLHNEYVASGRVSYELRYFMLNAFDVPATLLATCGATEAVIPLSEQFWAWQPTMFSNLQSVGDARLQQAAALPPGQRMQAISQLAGMTDFFAARGMPAWRTPPRPMHSPSRPRLLRPSTRSPARPASSSTTRPPARSAGRSWKPS
jgi:hypothetical protein